MQYLLQTFRQNRDNVINLLKRHTLEEVNTIPPDMNNNLIWNAGHLLLAQQILMYLFSDLSPHIPLEAYMPKYVSNTRPDGQATQAELDELLVMLDRTADQAIDDYRNGIFTTYQAYTSDYFGMSMNNIEEAIHFNTCHEGFHFGYMSAIATALRVSSAEQDGQLAREKAQ